MTRRTRGKAKSLVEIDCVKGAPLEPIRTVERELTRPDGTTVRVEVPVYPPFRLEERKPGRAPARQRSAPTARSKRRSGGAKG